MEWAVGGKARMIAGRYGHCKSRHYRRSANRACVRSGAPL